MESYLQCLKDIHFQPLFEENYNILLDHSPINSFVNPIRHTDLICCGHMHNGGIPSYISSILRGNFGLINPHSKIGIIQNTRGMKHIIENTNGIVFAPITTFGNRESLLAKFNFLYPPIKQQLIIKKR